MGHAYRLLVDQVGFPAEDVIIDPNIFAVATGIEEHAAYGSDFIEATAELRRRHPHCNVSGGVSNLSFAFRGNERVREAISSRPMLQREIASAAGQPMTASFGIASFPLHARSKEELVVRADRAMQSVKAASKNSIAVAELEDARRA